MKNAGRFKEVKSDKHDFCLYLFWHAIQRKSIYRVLQKALIFFTKSLIFLIKGQF